MSLEIMLSECGVFSQLKRAGVRDVIYKIFPSGLFIIFENEGNRLGAVRTRQGRH